MQEVLSKFWILVALSSRIDEQERLLEQKQFDLNDIRKELDHVKRHEVELEDELAATKERAAVMEKLLAEEDPGADGILHEDRAIYSAVQVDAARQAKAVVFGGPPNWQAEVKKAAPGFTCIPVTQKGFDTKIIDKADVIVFKTDYLSHAQWYRVVKRAKSWGRKIVYCRNNIDMLLMKVAGGWFNL